MVYNLHFSRPLELILGDKGGQSKFISQSTGQVKAPGRCRVPSCSCLEVQLTRQNHVKYHNLTQSHDRIIMCINADYE